MSKSIEDTDVSVDMMNDAVAELITQAEYLADEEVNPLISYFVSGDTVPSTDISTAFAWFTRLSFYGFRDVKSNLEKAYQDISESGYDIITSKGAGSVEGWNGKAATNYRQSFAEPFSTAAASQGILISALATFLGEMRELHMAGRRDAYTIAKNTTAQLKKARESNEDPIDWDTTLAVAGFAAALTGAVIAPPAGVAAITTSAALTITGSQAAKSVIDAADSEVSGESMTEIIGSMFNELERVREHIEAQDKQIAEDIDVAIEQTTTKLQDRGSDTDVGDNVKICPPRPSIIDDHSLSDVRA